MPLIKVRVQAKGGMFLAKDSYKGAKITLRDVSTGKILISGSTPKDAESGTRMSTYQPDSSFSTIVTPSNPQIVHWVTATESTAVFKTDLPLTKPTLIEFSAKVPLPCDQGDQQVLMTEWIAPEYNSSPGPGFVLEVPGLWVQPKVYFEEQNVRIAAIVTMMCGCKVDFELPWIPSDFQVEAVIMNKEEKKNIPLRFISESLFSSDFSLYKKGEYELEITAYQISTGNTGVAQTTFTVN